MALHAVAHVCQIKIRAVSRWHCILGSRAGAGGTGLRSVPHGKCLGSVWPCELTGIDGKGGGTEARHRVANHPRVGFGIGKSGLTRATSARSAVIAAVDSTL